MTRSADYPPEYVAYAREFGLNLQRLRSARGLTHRDIAEIAGLSENTYQKLESGHSKPDTPLNPRLRTLIRLSQALEVPVGEIMPDFPPDLTKGRRSAS